MTNIPIRMTKGFTVYSEDAAMVKYTPTYIGFLLIRNNPSVLRLFFFGCPEAERTPHREPPGIHESEPACPDQQREQSALLVSYQGYPDTPAPNNHCSPDYKDGIFAYVKQRPVNWRFPILFDVS